MEIKNQALVEELQKGYTFKGDSIIMGAPLWEDQVQSELFIRLPLKTFNRHGLISGATGTGKTKTLQIICEQLSKHGVPSLVMDIKGDLSGVAASGKDHPKIQERHEKIGLPFLPKGSPVEFLSLSEEKGVRLRATVTEFGPVLFSKMLGLNETQEGIVNVIFKYCDDNGLLLIDLKDFRRALLFLTQDAKEEIEREYGSISSASTGAIIRRLVELEQQGGDLFFGEPSFDVYDLCRHTKEGNGVISVLRLTDIQDKPKLFSTFMLQLLAEIYQNFEELGDPDKPELVLFIDEAHLIFNEATDALLNQIETIIKLIRSKGVGVFFITQNPTDVPYSVLSQLGMKVQHALRAFTARDRKAIKVASENFPITEHYDTDEIITALGIGEALVTCLDEKGKPTPLVHTLLRAPESRMDVLSEQELSTLIRSSKMVDKYNEAIDRNSAYEKLAERVGRIQEEKEEVKERKKERERKKDSIFNSPVAKQISRQVVYELTRGLMGMLGMGRRRRRY